MVYQFAFNSIHILHVIFFGYTSPENNDVKIAFSAVNKTAGFYYQ